jgi:hypothetical protein
MTDIEAFLSRCDRFCERSGMKPTVLSKRLFKGDAGRLRLLNDGGDLGIRKFDAILATLADLERTLEQEEAPS